jgi:heptosyltransferase-2
MHKILVLRGGALGDFIVTLPALALLRERWPEARIELAGNAVAAQLALKRGLIDAVHPQHEARWAGLFGDAALSDEFAAWLGGFDLVINFWPDVDGELSRHFPRDASQRFLCAPAMPMQTPAAAHYCEPLRAIGIEAREYFHRLSPLAHARSCERSGYIAIHPGSGSPRKNWPAENWRRLIAELHAPVSLILGEAEGNTFDVAPALVAAPEGANKAGVNLSRTGLSRADKRQPYVLQNQPLEKLVEHLTAARLFLGHDSGISHLAAACGVRCVLLFGPTEPTMWAPPAPNVRVLRSEPLASFPVEDVRGAVEEALADQR